jgi:hypothetical protein
MKRAICGWVNSMNDRARQVPHQALYRIEPQRALTASLRSRNGIESVESHKEVSARENVALVRSLCL